MSSPLDKLFSPEVDQEISSAYQKHIENKKSSLKRPASFFQPSKTFNEIPLLPPEIAIGVENFFFCKAKPSGFQQFVLPQMLLGRDVCAIDRAGTGKTTAMLIAAICRVGIENIFPKNKKENKEDKDDDQDSASSSSSPSPGTKAKCFPKLLYLFPVRELVVAVTDVMQRLVSSIINFDLIKEQTGIEYTKDNIVVPMVGGTPVRPQITKLITYQPPFIFATPGRCMDMIARGVVGCGDISAVYIEELDRALEMGFEDIMRDLVMEIFTQQHQKYLIVPDVQFCVNLSSIRNQEVHQFIRKMFNPRWSCFLDCVDNNTSQYLALTRKNSTKKNKTSAHYIVRPNMMKMNKQDQNNNSNNNDDFSTPFEQKSQALFDFLFERFQLISLSMTMDGENASFAPDDADSYLLNMCVVFVDSAKTLEALRTSFQSIASEDFFKFLVFLPSHEEEKDREFTPSTAGLLALRQLLRNSIQGGGGTPLTTEPIKKLTKRHVVFLAVDQDKEETNNFRTMLSSCLTNRRAQNEDFYNKFKSSTTINFNVASSFNDKSSPSSSSASKRRVSTFTALSSNPVLSFREEVSRIRQGESSVLISDKFEHFLKFRGSSSAGDYSAVLEGNATFIDNSVETEVGEVFSAEEGENNPYRVAMWYSNRFPGILQATSYMTFYSSPDDEYKRQQAEIERAKLEPRYKIYNFVWEDTIEEDVEALLKLKKVFDIDFEIME